MSFSRRNSRKQKNNVETWSPSTSRGKVQNLDDKLLNALRSDSVDDAVVEEELQTCEDSHVFASGHSKSFRKRLEHVLHSTPAEIVLIVLVIIDVIILLAMLVMDLHILQMQLYDMKTDAKAVLKSLQTFCDNPSITQYNGTDLIKITKYLDDGECFVNPPTVANSSNVDSHNIVKRAAGGGNSANPTVKLLTTIGHYLHYMSISILAIMVIEVLLKISAMGQRYFKGKLEVIDGIIIVISFALDIYFTDGVGTGGGNAASVLVILLMWRMIRVFNALLVTAKKRLQFRIRVQKRMRKTLDDKISGLHDELETMQKHIDNLIRMAKLHNMPEYEIRACKPLVHALKNGNTNAGLVSMMQMSMGLLHGMNSINPSGEPADDGEPTLSKLLNRRPSIDETREPSNAGEIKQIMLSSHNIAPEEIAPPEPVPSAVDFVQAIAAGERKAELMLKKRAGSTPIIAAMSFTRAVALGGARHEGRSVEDAAADVRGISMPNLEAELPRSNPVKLACTRNRSISETQQVKETMESLPLLTIERAASYENTYTVPSKIDQQSSRS